MADEEGGEGPGEGGDVYPYGDYKGSRDENLDRHGWGSALLPNGDIYEGEYRHGLRMGKGLYCFRNGARYNGEWRKGLKHGKGEFIYPDGSVYKGEWRKDLKHGQGVYTYPNGDIYEGAWYRGWRHGLGTYRWVKVNLSHYGMWNNGRMEGPAIVNYPCYRYHGSFKKNLPIGPGCFTFENKYMQHGFYINIRNPAFDYIGVEELELQKENKSEEDEDRATPKGIVPIWRARKITPYKPELLPREPHPVPIQDSEDSLLDIMQYLQKQYAQVGATEEEEGNLHLPSQEIEEEMEPTGAV